MGEQTQITIFIPGSQRGLTDFLNSVSPEQNPVKKHTRPGFLQERVSRSLARRYFYDREWASGRVDACRLLLNDDRPKDDRCVE